MATDVDKPAGQDSPLRQAMQRAGSAVGKTVQRLGEAARRMDEPFILTEADMERRPMNRVTVKTTVLGYIDAAFQNRTRADGTILAPSRERLVEELTNLYMDLEAGLYDMPAPPAMPAPKAPLHSHAEPVKTE